MTTLSWGHLLVLLAVALAVIVIGGLVVRRWRRAGTDVATSITLTGSAFYAAVALLGAIVTFVNLMVSSQVQMTVPVQNFWPTLPDQATVSTTGATAEHTGGGFTEAQLWVEHISTGARVLWASGQALGVLVPAGIAALIAVACFQLLRGRAFAPVVSRVAVVTAFLVLVGGMLAPSLSQFAGSLVSHELFDIDGFSASGIPDGVDVQSFMPQAAMTMQIPLWPIGAAFGFAALAAVLTYGTRLQRETEGLV